MSHAEDIKSGPLPDIDTLEIVADWKADLRTRYERAKLRYELIGGNGPEIEVLGAEMRDFKRLCQVLKAVTHA
jgi:hypothetical protein